MYPDSRDLIGKWLGCKLFLKSLPETTLPVRTLPATRKTEIEQVRLAGDLMEH
jgi:hypothetical protein